MKIEKIGMIGHFCINGNMMDGQTVKTKEINQFIEEYYKKETLKYDTYKNNRNPIKIVTKTYSIMKNSENVILIVSSRGYKVLLPIINFFNIFLKRKIFDFVIGGVRYKLFDKNIFLKRMAQRVYKIYVETEKIEKEYIKRGITNVEVIPNFKNVESIKKEQINSNTNKKAFKFCTFSRVTLAKGIEDSIEAIKIANSKMNSNIFELDIYGGIDEDYKDRFEEISKNFPDFIKYKGCVDSKNAINVLKKYDCMLFLTYWKAEGFPGTLIDALGSGLPVIATDWNYNFDILTNGKTGYMADIKNPGQVADKIVEIYQNQKEVIEMKYNCIAEANKYKPQEAMKNFISEIK